MNYNIIVKSRVDDKFQIPTHLKPDLPNIGNNLYLPKTISKSFGYKPTYLFFYNERTLEALIFGCSFGNKFVATPHLSYGGVFTSSSFELSNYNLEKIFKTIEIRSFSKLTKYYKEDKVCSILQLSSDPNTHFSNLKYNIRRQIRIAIDNGLNIKYGKLEILEDFYIVYSRSMHRLGSPPQPKSFFINLLRSEKDYQARIFCAYQNEIPIGTAFTIGHNEVIESCWAGSLWEYNKYYTMYLLYWEMIKFTINHNFKVFSFGRSNKDSGSLRFKKHWKSETIPLYVNIMGETSTSLRAMRFMNKVIPNLPYSVNLYLGKIFTKHLY